MERKTLNIRNQIIDALETTGYPVNGAYPAGKVKLPRLIYSQVSHAYAGPSTDILSYRIDCYASTPEKAIDMVSEVDNVMYGLNFVKTYESSDDDCRLDMGLYKKVVQYRGTADLIFERLL